MDPLRDRPEPPSVEVRAYFDGLCEPRNPGGYACGGWFVEPNPAVTGLEAGIRDCGFYLSGAGATNNVAEYSAALDALRAVYRAGYRGDVVLHGDSQLVVRQFNGEWKCRSEHLLELLGRLHQAVDHFASVRVVWVPREQNAVADGLSRKAYALTRVPTTPAKP